MSHTNIQSQRGGTLLGFVLGLVIGLIIALGVAMYVTKVPMPFSNKNQSRSADQDAVEAEKNKDWNPNGAIQSKPVTPEAPTDATAANPAAAAAAGVPNPGAAAAPAVTADPLADLAKKQNPNSAPAASTPAAPAPAASTPPPAATPQPANKAPSTNDPFTYFVQAGAFKSAADADAQKDKLSMMGIEAKVSEREQAGRAIFRVRSGPFDDKDQAEKIKARLDASGMDAALVRVQR
ncbi:MAG: SPOR domain-containing protein [Burkholderiales bacterium]